MRPQHKLPQAVFIVLLALCLSGTHADIKQLPVKTVTNGIHVYQGLYEISDRYNLGAISNIGFIVGDNCVAVIDTGGTPEVGRMLKHALQDITDKPVCYVINTHVHPDHIFGNSAFVHDNVQFVGHHKLPRAIAFRAQSYLDSVWRETAHRLTDNALIPPTLLVKDTLTLDLGNRLLRLRAYPTAHTDHDLSIYDEQTGTLWLGDLLFMQRIPVIDGSINGWLAVLDELRGREVQRVIPGHGPIDVTDWPSAADAEQHYLTLLQTEIRQIISDGGTIEQAINEVGFSATDSWLLFNHYHKRNVTAAFAELEWE